MYDKTTVKYDGELREFVLADLDLGNPSDPTDAELKTALSIALNTPNLDGFVIARADTVINVMPNPTFAKE